MVILSSFQALAEADTFFCFVELISGFRDLFCQQLDNSVAGIRSTISKLSKLLKEHDEELWRHLEVTTKVSGLCHLSRCCNGCFVLHMSDVCLCTFSLALHCVGFK